MDEEKRAEGDVEIITLQRDRWQDRADEDVFAEPEVSPDQDEGALTVPRTATDMRHERYGAEPSGAPSERRPTHARAWIGGEELLIPLTHETEMMPDDRTPSRERVSRDPLITTDSYGVNRLVLTDAAGNEVPWTPERRRRFLGTEEAVTGRAMSAEEFLGELGSRDTADDSSDADV